MHYRRHGVTTSSSANPAPSSEQPRATKKSYSVSSLINKRDFLGAITLIEFEKELSTKQQKKNNNQQDESSKIEQLENLAYCHFHLGHYEKAKEIYLDLYENESSDPIYSLFVAVCLFHLGKYEKCTKYLSKSPTNRLSNRLSLHLAFAYYKDEKKMVECMKKLSDSTHDQLCLASIHFNRSKYQNATDIYKQQWMKNKKEHIAIQIYVAYCFFELDRYDTSNDIIGPYLAKHPNSIIAQNLKSCNNYRLYNGKLAQKDVQSILEVMKVTNCDNPFFNIIKHNLCVFGDGENALEILPPLINVIDEARLNLCIYHLKNEEYIAAYQILQKYLKKPKSAIEYILKAIVCSLIGQIKQSERELKIAIKYFELVGTSQSECDTIPGRQSMASYHILNKSFDEVIIYLESIKEYVCTSQASSDIFNFNYGLALSHTSRFKEAENALLLIQNPIYKLEYVYLSHLCRCYVMNGRPWEAWNTYLSSSNNDDHESMMNHQTNWNLLYLIAHDCYKVGQFYYSCKAFDALEALEPNTEFWNGKRGACCGVLQQVIAGKEMKEHLLDIMQMLDNDPNPQANFILRVMRQWCQDNDVQDY